MKQETDHEAETSAWNHENKRRCQSWPFPLELPVVLSLNAHAGEGLRNWCKSLRSCCPFCMGRELALLIPLFPLAHEQPGEGKDQPKEAPACLSGSSASSALREQQLWTGLHEVWPTFLWILHSVGRNTFHRMGRGRKKNLLKSFQFLPVCSKGQIGSFSLLTV